MLSPRLGGVVGFCGPRSLGPAGCAWVSAAAGSLVRSAGAVVVAGCAFGADAESLSGALAAGPLVRCVAVGSSAGLGFPAPGVPSVVARVAALGPGRVAWLAGGPLAVPLAARLAARSLAFVRWLASSGGVLVAAVAAPPPRGFGPGPFPRSGSGSWSSVAAAALLGVPVFAVWLCAGPFPAPALPAPGSWAPVAGGLFGARAWGWAPGFLPGFGPAWG